MFDTNQGPDESIYTYDDYHQDQLAEEAMRLHDEHEREVAQAGGACKDLDCFHNYTFAHADTDVDRDIPF
jgi:hypothetical protein